MSRLLHRTVSFQPDVAVRGAGLLLTLKDGRQIVDASGGAAVACLGHGNARVARAIGAQAAKMAYAHTGFFTSEPAEALADLLLEHEPGGLSHAWRQSSIWNFSGWARRLSRPFAPSRW